MTEPSSSQGFQKFAPARHNRRQDRIPSPPRNSFEGGHGFASNGYPTQYGYERSPDAVKAARLSRLDDGSGSRRERCNGGRASAASAPEAEHEAADPSTLDYLDRGGRVQNFYLVPWATLHNWLSTFNGADGEDIPEGLTRSQVLQELERRRKQNPQGLQILASAVRQALVDVGDGKDWREHEQGGLTHFEELLVYQPEDWRRQAREYLFLYHFNVNRVSADSPGRRTTVPVTYRRDYEELETEVPVFMSNALLVVLFHPELLRSKRYQPLSFLLSYDAELVPETALKVSRLRPLDHFLANLEVCESELDTFAVKAGFMTALSPLDYLFHFADHVAKYDVEIMRQIGKNAGVPRFHMLKELDFCDIFGQRLAKHLIRKNVLHWLTNRQSADNLIPNRSPLSMIFAGPSGNGKTELGKVLSELLNKPADEAFHKVDCGKLSDAHELFGMAGAYQGAEKGSALNNFVLRMARSGKVGVVLLDEIEKASRDVIHALYQVIDKGEWTNKKLDRRGDGPQTGVVSCQNLIFVLTTNAADSVIEDLGQKDKWYTAPWDQLDDMADELERTVRTALEDTYPFTPAFTGRIGAVVPFLQMSNRYPPKHPLLGELLTVTKFLIEREQEKLSVKSQIAQIDQRISPLEKEKIAEIVMRDASASAGVRSVQKLVGDRMGRQIMHRFALRKGSLHKNSTVEYRAHVDDRQVSFWELGSHERSSAEEVDQEDDEELYS